MDDIFDLLAFILLFGACIAITFGLVLPAVYDFNDPMENALLDKTAPVEVGYGNESNYDGTMSKMDVVLLSQVQDFSMPEPKKYKINGSMVDVTANYRGMLQEIGISVFNMLDDVDPNGTGRYEIDYYYGKEPSIDDIDTGNLLKNSKAEDEVLGDEGEVLPEFWETYTTDLGDVVFGINKAEPISGNGSFEILARGNLTEDPDNDNIGSYYQEVTVEPSTTYRISGVYACERCEGYIEVELSGPEGVVGTYTTRKAINTSEPTRNFLEFTTPINAVRAKISLVKGRSVGAVEDEFDVFRIDEVSLQKLDGSEPHYVIRMR